MTTNYEIVTKGINERRDFNQKHKEISTNYFKRENVLYIKSYRKIIAIVDYSYNIIYQNINTYSKTTKNHMNLIYHSEFEEIEIYTDSPRYEVMGREKLYEETLKWYKEEIRKTKNYSPRKEHTKERKREKLKRLKENKRKVILREERIKRILLD